MGKLFSTMCGVVLGSCLTLGIVAVARDDIKLVPYYAKKYLSVKTEPTVMLSGTVLEEGYYPSVWGDEYVVSLKTNEGKKVVVFDDHITPNEPKYLNALFQPGDTVTIKTAKKNENIYAGLEGHLSNL